MSIERYSEEKRKWREMQILPGVMAWRQLESHRDMMSITINRCSFFHLTDAFIHNNIIAACMKVASSIPSRDSVILYLLDMVYMAPTDGLPEAV